MQFARFNARCPFEIGDKIKSRRRVSPEEAANFNLSAAAVVEEVHTITDIVCEHSVKHGTVVFLYELDNSGKLVHIIAPRDEKQDTPKSEQEQRAAEEVGPTSTEQTVTRPGPFREERKQEAEERSTRGLTMVIADESSPLPPEFKEFIKKRFG